MSAHKFGTREPPYINMLMFSGVIWWLLLKLWWRRGHWTNCCPLWIILTTLCTIYPTGSGEPSLTDRSSSADTRTATLYKCNIYLDNSLSQHFTHSKEVLLCCIDHRMSVNTYSGLHSSHLNSCFCPADIDTLYVYLIFRFTLLLLFNSDIFLVLCYMALQLVMSSIHLPHLCYSVAFSMLTLAAKPLCWQK